MSFQPVVPLSGYGGWVFLNRTLDQQKNAFTQSGEAARNSAYFSETIGQVESAEELVSDRRLMSVALDAFGLGDDINAKAFVRKVLESPTGDREALAGKLSDKRYAAMAKALGFGDDKPLTTDRVADIVARYQDRSFEAALGEVDNTMRMALNLGSALQDIDSSVVSADGKWFAVMGNPAVRKVFETALGFPTSFGALDIDQQLEQFKERSERVLGTSDVAQFLEPEGQEKLLRMFFVRSEMANPSAVQSHILTLLR